MKINIFKSRLILWTVILLVVDGLFFGLTDPNRVNSLFLIAGFVLIGLNSYIFMKDVLAVLYKAGFQIKNRRKITGFVTALICLLLGLQSIGQLSGRDILIIIPLAILLYIYLAYIRPKTLA